MTTSELQLFKAAFLQSWNAIVITDADAEAGYLVQAANPAFCAMTGYSLEELRGGRLKCLQGPDTDPQVIDRMRRCLKEARYFEGTTTNYRKDGSSYIVHWTISPVRDNDGVLTHFVSVQEDISSAVLAERENRLLARALDAASDPVVLTDSHAHIIFVNTAFTQLTGYTLDEVKGSTPGVLHSGQHDTHFYETLYQALAKGEAFRATFINRRRDGSLYHAEQSISPVSDEKGRITHFVSVSKDISERVDEEQALRYAASHDPLTGLFNRRHGEKLLHESYHTAAGQRTPLALVVCDIDHFKRVNDRFGHPAGDRILSSVARTLRNAVRGKDAVVRWGGEEFLIVLDNCTTAAGLDLAERIRKRIEAHRDDEGGTVTLSLGLATLQDGESIQQLIARADAALYEAKRSGRNRTVASVSG